VPSKATQSSGPSSSAGGRIKTTGKKRKGKDAAQDDDLVEQQPNYNTSTVQIASWRRLGEENPYRFTERTCTGGDEEFLTKTQAYFWDDFYNSPEHMENGTFVQPRAINKEELLMFSATEYRIVVDTLQKMVLLDLVCLKPDNSNITGEYCPILVCQFHCTIFFYDDPARTMTWMIEKEQYSCNYLDFCQAMGFGAGRARGFQIHTEDPFHSR
jgi:hypothetical protein